MKPPSTPGKRGARVASLRCSTLHASKIIVRQRRTNASGNCCPPSTLVQCDKSQGVWGTCVREDLMDLLIERNQLG